MVKIIQNYKCRLFRFRSLMKILIFGQLGSISIDLGSIKGSIFYFLAFETITIVIATKFYTRLMV